MPFLFFWRSGFFSIRAARQDSIGNLPSCFPGFRPPPHCSAPIALPPRRPPSFCPVVFPSPVFSPFRSATLPPVSPPPRFSPLRGLTLPLLLEAQPLKPGSSQAGRNCHTDSILLTQNPWRIDDRKRRTYRKNNKRLHGSS